MAFKELCATVSKGFCQDSLGSKELEMKHAPVPEAVQPLERLQQTQQRAHLPTALGLRLPSNAEIKGEHGPKMSLFPTIKPGEQGQEEHLLPHGIGDGPRAGPKRPEGPN